MDVPDQPLHGERLFIAIGITFIIILFVTLGYMRKHMRQNPLRLLMRISQIWSEPPKISELWWDSSRVVNQPAAVSLHFPPAPLSSSSRMPSLSWSGLVPSLRTRSRQKPVSVPSTMQVAFIVVMPVPRQSSSRSISDPPPDSDRRESVYSIGTLSLPAPPDIP
ncbi:hypothetical protein FISHEDRAFT_62381 [Fistulina hepatica ATCC 64428]|nr:hypothetical protein FISHEDRAFT_62381 [Fistulina hepatica ATCC 64428]